LLSFLALNPNAPPILSTALLSVYCLRPYFTSRSMTSIFDHGIVWLEHRPALVLLIRQRRVSRKKRHRNGALSVSPAGGMEVQSGYHTLR
jgi:hypothetical protein